MSEREWRDRMDLPSRFYAAYRREPMGTEWELVGFAASVAAATGLLGSIPAEYGETWERDDWNSSTVQTSWTWHDSATMWDFRVRTLTFEGRRPTLDLKRDKMPSPWVRPAAKRAEVDWVLGTKDPHLRTARS